MLYQMSFNISDPTFNSASAALTSKFRRTAMFDSVDKRNYKVPRIGDNQWHDIHTEFH
jgi:hypothetical protein